MAQRRVLPLIALLILTLSASSSDAATSLVVDHIDIPQVDYEPAIYYDQGDPLPHLDFERIALEAHRRQAAQTRGARIRLCARGGAAGDGPGVRPHRQANRSRRTVEKRHRAPRRCEQSHWLVALDRRDRVYASGLRTRHHLRATLDVEDLGRSPRKGIYVDGNDGAADGPDPESQADSPSRLSGAGDPDPHSQSRSRHRSVRPLGQSHVGPGGENELTDNTEFIIPTESILIADRWQKNLGPSPQVWSESPLRYIPRMEGRRYHGRRIDGRLLQRLLPRR